MLLKAWVAEQAGGAGACTRSAQEAARRGRKERRRSTMLAEAQYVLGRASRKWKACIWARREARIGTWRRGALMQS
jgi:hypothetical protein